jgi:Mor family transcriptional regulator
MPAAYASLEQLTELIGLPAALRLIDAFGGTCIYVPLPGMVKAHGRVARVIGAEAMARLAGAWPQEYVMVPRGAEYLRRQRAIAIHRDAPDLSVSELARKYEMTERNIYLVLARPAPVEPAPGGTRPARAQLDLFGD